MNRVRVMVFNATYNNISVISWRLVLLVEETRENSIVLKCCRHKSSVLLRQHFKCNMVIPILMKSFKQ